MMTIPDPVEVYKGSLSSGSHAVIDSRVKLLAAALDFDEPRSIDWSALDYAKAAKAVAFLRGKVAAGRLKAATVNAAITALKRIAEEAVRLEMLDEKTGASISRIRLLAASAAMRGRAVESDDLRRLFDFSVDDLRDYRDKAILAVLFGAGLRRAELVALSLDSLVIADEMPALQIRHGKRDKDRTVYLPEDAIEHLNDWLDHRGDHAGAMFQRITKSGGLVADSRLTAQSVYLICRGRALKAGIQVFTPHDARRTVITELLDATDVITVADVAGHTDINTTRRYDRRGDRAKREAARRFPIKLR